MCNKTFTKLDVSRETLDKFSSYYKSLIDWQKSMNLVGSRTIECFWDRHVLDSLSLRQFIDRSNVRNILDMGSGAGLPGLVLAMTIPDKTFHLCEANAKKIAFMRHVSRETFITNVIFLYQRVETVDQSSSFDVVTARAFAPLKDCVDLASPWLTKGAIGYFHKGKNHLQEISKIDLSQYDHVIHANPTEKDSVIVEVRRKA